MIHFTVNKSITIALLFFLFAFSLNAQEIKFEELIQATNNIDRYSNSDSDYADIDGDNDLDFVVIGSNSSSNYTKIYLNNGNGYFTPSTNILEGVEYGSVIFLDIDNDGDKDLLSSGKNNNNDEVTNLYKNNGEGIFTKVVGTSFISAYRGDISYADIDNDNDLDLLISGETNGERKSELYLNDGQGNYGLISGSPITGMSHSKSAFSDIDGDNDLDLIITGYTQSAQIATELYTNNGNGYFSLNTNESLVNLYGGDVAFADIDGDNDNDLLLTGYYNSVKVTKLYKNNGNGYFSLVSNVPFVGLTSSSVEFADVDNDNDLDLVVMGKYSSDVYGTTRLYMNDGLGHFVENTAFDFSDGSSGNIVVFDFNGDNKKDIITVGFSSNYDHSAMYLNKGNGLFSNLSDNVLPAVRYGDIAFADVDNDGDQDAFIVGTTSSSSYYTDSYVSSLYLNTGGVFSLDTRSTFEAVVYSSLAFADIDNDGDKDVLISGENTDGIKVINLYKNDGTGKYTVVENTAFEAIKRGEIDFADVDNDGDQDVLISGTLTNNEDRSILYKNDGQGNFTGFASPFVGMHNGDIEFCDIDNDNDLDVFITGNGNSRLYINVENGNFVETQSSTFPNLFNSSVAIGKVNNNNYSSIIIMGYLGQSLYLSRLYNNINGLFEEQTTLNLNSLDAGSVDLFDLDNDGDLDILLTGRNYYGSENTYVYSNDNNGNFTNITSHPFIEIFNSSVKFVDLDNDGDKDLVMMGTLSNQNQIRLYKNTAVVGIAELEKNSSLVVFPNPNKGELIIKYNQTYLNSTVNILNSSGKILNSQIILNPMQTKIIINQPEGLYFLQIIKSNGDSEVLKIIKQ